MMDTKNWPIRGRKPWVRGFWAGLGALSLLTSVVFLARAAKLGIPVSWGGGGLLATAFWFAFGIVNPQRMKLVSCIAIALGVGVLATGTVSALAFLCAAFFALSMMNPSQASQ